jgi:hypothetical protein
MGNELKARGEEEEEEGVRGAQGTMETTRAFVIICSEYLKADH